MVQLKASKGGSKEKKIGGAKKKKNVFKVVETKKKVKVVETKEKPETDEEFHRKMVQETSKKSKKKKNDQVNLLLPNEEDDFVQDNTSHIGDESGDEDDDIDQGDYSKFMEEMSKLDGKKQKISSTRNDGGQVSEFNLASSRGSKVIKHLLYWG